MVTAANEISCATKGGEHSVCVPLTDRRVGLGQGGEQKGQ